MHANATEIARSTIGTVSDRMNQMGQQFSDTVPSQLAAVLFAVGAITLGEYYAILDDGFEFNRNYKRPGIDNTGYDAQGKYHPEHDVRRQYSTLALGPSIKTVK